MAKKELKQAKKEAKGSSDNKLLMSVSHSRKAAFICSSSLWNRLFTWVWYTVFVFSVVEKKKKAVQRCEEQLLKMEVQATDREENKQIALGTSKLNYLDPRITVAW